MISRAAALTILSFLLGGCAAYHSDDASVKEALQERDAAYIRVCLLPLVGPDSFPRIRSINRPLDNSKQ